MQHLDPSKNTLLSETLKRETEGFVPKFVPLPNDADVARFDSIPPERRDFVDLKKICKSQICVGMGIPETSVDGKFEGVSNGLASRMTEEFIRVSLMPLKNALNGLLLELYENSIGDSRKIDCNFPGLQNIDRLYFWYQNGLLKRESLVKSICDLELHSYRFAHGDDAGNAESSTTNITNIGCLGSSPTQRLKFDDPSDKILRK